MKLHCTALCLIFLSLSTLGRAQTETGSRDLYRVSQVFLIGAAVADVTASYQATNSGYRVELNPLLSRNGKLQARGVAISLSMTAGAVLLQELAVRKWPPSRKVFRWLNFGVGGVRLGFATHGWRALG